MRFVLCWGPFSGYMAACWRALAAVPGVQLHVIAPQPRGHSFDTDLLAGIHCRLLTEQEASDEGLVAALVRERRPDVLYTTGWFSRAYRHLITSREFETVVKWLGVDTPWLGTWRQHLARVALRRLVRRADRTFVAGERAWQYMRLLGVSETRIRRGLYGVDHAALSPLYDQRLARSGGWPKRFLFVGRYAPEKGITTLLDGYESYRLGAADPWPLGCCGSGPLESMLRGRAGVENHGFKQPAEVMEIMREHGAFVLPSHFDPWPLVVVEASAAGLPVLCSESCGSAVELVRPYYNGVTVTTGDAEALARGMRWMHDHHAELTEMGRRGRELAAAYSAEAWATRWAQAANECVGGG